MLLQSIKLENFRQFTDEKIDFSTDPERNVTLIIGENGTGKTTFAQTFFWCLYGETDFTDKILLNRKVADKLLPDQKATVRVELRLTHGSANYEIVRTQDYKKNLNNKLNVANSVLNIAVKSGDGNTRFLKPLECETEIKKILPKELSNYFFFDGERIEKMSKEIASGKKSSGFSDAVVGLTGLKATLAALSHLSPTKSTSVIGKLNEEYVGDSAGKIARLTSEIDEIQKKLDENAKRLLELDEEIKNAEVSKKNFEDQLKQYAEGEKLQHERDKIRSGMFLAKKTKSEHIKEMCSAFNSGFSTFASMSMVKRSLDIIANSDFGGKDIPEMHSKTVNFLLKRGMCICGTQLMEGSLPYNNVSSLLEFLPPQSIGVTVGQFVKDARRNYESEVKFYEKIADKLSLVCEQDDVLGQYQKDLDDINNKLEGDDVKEQIKKLNSQIQTCEAILKSRQMEQKNTLMTQGGLETQKSLKENSRSELSLLDGKNQRVERLKAYATRLYTDLLKDYKCKEKEIRSKLEHSINEIFKQIYDGGLSLSIDDKYNISVYVTDFEGGVETSTAQSISVIFAFISAIIKMARDNQKENDKETYSEPYPLVMDAPLSAFDKRRIKAICSAIPETAEQVIIFIKDTDGEIAETHLGSKVSTRHYFEKLDEFSTRLV